MTMLFFGLNYTNEGLLNGTANGVNGYTVYSEYLIKEISKNCDLTVVTDRPENFIGLNTFNIFY